MNNYKEGSTFFLRTEIDKDMRGAAPEYVFTGLKRSESENGRIYAGKTELLALKKTDPKKAKAWLLCPFTDTMARHNKKLFIVHVASSNKRTWRLIESGKTRNFYDFKRLENARAVYWDMVRGIVNWASEGRMRELGFIVGSFRIRVPAGIELKKGDRLYWDLPDRNT